MESQVKMGVVSVGRVEQGGRWTEADERGGQCVSTVGPN